MGKKGCGLEKCRGRGCSSAWNQAKLKCQSRGRRQLSVFQRCCDAAGPQGAPPSHSSGSCHLYSSGSCHLHGLGSTTFVPWGQRWELRRARTQRGFQARGLQMCLSGAGGLSSAPLPLAGSKPGGGPSWIWDFSYLP